MAEYNCPDWIQKMIEKHPEQSFATIPPAPIIKSYWYKGESKGPYCDVYICSYCGETVIILNPNHVLPKRCPKCDAEILGVYRSKEELHKHLNDLFKEAEKKLQERGLM